MQAKVFGGSQSGTAVARGRQPAPFGLAARVTPAPDGQAGPGACVPTRATGGRARIRRCRYRIYLRPKCPAIGHQSGRTYGKCRMCLNRKPKIVGGSLSQAHEGRQLRDRVVEDGVRRLERPHELAEQLEADHPEQLRPRDHGADQHVRGNGAGTGRGGDGGLGRGRAGERRRQRRGERRGLGGERAGELGRLGGGRRNGRRSPRRRRAPTRTRAGPGWPGRPSPPAPGIPAPASRRSARTRAGRATAHARIARHAAAHRSRAGAPPAAAMAASAADPIAS